MEAVMKKGDLRRFRDSSLGLGADHVEGSTFMVLRVSTAATGRIRGVDILVGGRIETGWSLTWVMDNSEAVSEAG